MSIVLTEDPVMPVFSPPAPKLTIAMPVFNPGDFLRASVLSILRQSFQDWELLLIDDGSTDGAVDALSDLVDDRIQIIRDGINRGLAARLNQAIDMARGIYFARMDGDDISYPDRLLRQIDYLENHPDVDLLGARAVAISEDNQLLGALPFAETHLQICASPWRGFYLPHPTWMGPLAWFRRQRYALPAPYLCEDQELLLRASAGSHYHALPETLLAYRVRRNVVWRKAIKTRLAFLGLQSRYFREHNQYGALAAAVGVLILRVELDALNCMLQIAGGRSLQRQSSGPLLPNGDAEQWRKVLKTLE